MLGYCDAGQGHGQGCGSPQKNTQEFPPGFVLLNGAVCILDQWAIAERDGL